MAPIWTYFAVSLSNVIATTCQYEALKYVSFPVQTLGKCAKMLPVMIWGILMLRKKYKAADWGLALVITSGCTVFLLTGDVKSKVSESLWQSSIYGLALMLGYLGFDGFTSTFQDKLFKGYNMTTYNQMLYTTMCSSILSMLGEKRRGCVRAGMGLSLTRYSARRWGQGGRNVLSVLCRPPCAPESPHRPALSPNPLALPKP